MGKKKSQEDAPITYSTPNSEWDILASYEAGSIIDIDVVFTNYHWVSVRASYRLIDTDGGLAMGALPWGPYSVNSTAGLCLVAHSLQRHDQFTLISQKYSPNIPNLALNPYILSTIRRHSGIWSQQVVSFTGWLGWLGFGWVGLVCVGWMETINYCLELVWIK